MTIEVRCSSCKKLLKAKDTMAGKKVKCPGCGSAIKLPGGKQNDFDDVEVVEDEEEELFGGYSAKDAVGALIDDPQKKECPECGEMIRIEAKRCPMCGEEFERRPAQKRRRTLDDVPSSSSGGDELTAVDWILCLCCSTIGCIVGIVRLCQGRSSGGVMIGVSIGAAIAKNLIGVLIMASKGG